MAWRAERPVRHGLFEKEASSGSTAREAGLELCLVRKAGWAGEKETDWGGVKSETRMVDCAARQG